MLNIYNFSNASHILDKYIFDHSHHRAYSEKFTYLANVYILMHCFIVVKPFFRITLIAESIETRRRLYLQDVLLCRRRDRTISVKYPIFLYESSK